jgi:hypothetical protein
MTADLVRWLLQEHQRIQLPIPPIMEKVLCNVTQESRAPSKLNGVRLDAHPGSSRQPKAAMPSRFVVGTLKQTARGSPRAVACLDEPCPRAFYFGGESSLSAGSLSAKLVMICCASLAVATARAGSIVPLRSPSISAKKSFAKFAHRGYLLYSI